MDKRHDTRQEILLDVRNEPITMDELVEQCHRALSAYVWTTSCWSEGGSNWKIGDFNYLVVSVAPDEDTSLYVQVWSEPRERVLMEVGSGERCPSAIRYIGPAQRKSLDARGYTVGGGAKNYQKELVIDSPVAAEAAAHEMLQVVFEVFGYRGQWRLEVERYRGERAEHHAVHTSLTPEDVAKAATRAGCCATVTKSGEAPIVALICGRRAFRARLDWRVPRRNLFSLIALEAELTLKQPVSDEAISRVNSGLLLVKVSRTDTHTVRMHMPLVLNGGVTMVWLAQSLRHWMRSWRECERQFRRAAEPTMDHPAWQHAELIH